MAMNRRHGWRRWLALGVAHLLALQVLFAGLTIGAVAAPEKLDFFGNVICSADGRHADRQGPVPDHSHGKQCCVLGCSASFASALTPPAPANVLPLRTASDEAMAYEATAVIAAAIDRTPHNARAPPRAV